MNEETVFASNPLETEDLRFLDPRALRFRRHGSRLRLTIEGGVQDVDVSVVRVFPLSNPRRYVSVRDADESEIGMIVDVRELAAESRQLVEEELERRYIVPIIQRVLSVRERFGAIDWTVETDRGARSFTTRNLRENVVQPAPNRYVLTDVDGNRYDVRDVDALDGMSRGWLLRYL